MKNKIVCISLISLATILGCAVGCSKDNNSEDTKKNNDSHISDEKEKESKDYFSQLPSSIEDGEYVLCVNENNQEILKDITMNASIVFHVLSKEELNADDVNVEIETSNQFDLLKCESLFVNEKFDKNICMLYNDIDWELLRRLQMSSDSSKQEEFTKISNEIDSQYDSLNDEMFPKFYDNCFKVQFNVTDSFKSEEINEMKVTVKGKEYNLNIGKMIFVDNYEEDVVSNVLNFLGIGIMDYNFKPNKEGEILLPGGEIEAADNVTIKDIRLMNNDKNIDIDEVSFEYEVDDNIIDIVRHPKQIVKIKKHYNNETLHGIQENTFVKYLPYDDLNNQRFEQHIHQKNETKKLWHTYRNEL